MFEDTDTEIKTGILGQTETADQSPPIDDGFFDKDQVIEGVPTSYTPDTAEVLSYRQQIREGDPSTLYEFLQNAFDYNDYSQGPPGVEIVLNNGEVLNLGQIITLDESEFLDLHKQVAQVRVSNYIDENRYYKVEHLIQTRHGGGEGTLGQHGRGGKAGSTALIAEGCIDSVQFSSRDENGPWKARGEVSVRPDLFRHQKTPSYNILYQDSDDDVEVNKSVVTFNKPGLRFFQLLFKLPQKFLLINHNYQGYSQEGESTLQPKENLFTVWAGEANFDGEHASNLSPEEVELLSLPTGTEFTETPRIEILPDGVVPRGRSRTDMVCVDGLLLETNSYHALQWSFWGCGFGKSDRHKNNGYYINRSPESRYAQGEWKKLMALTLGKCTSQGVFKTILDNSHGGSSCAEGDLPKDKLLETLKSHPKAMEAFKSAWVEFKREHNIAPETLFTSDSYVEEMMRKRNTPVFRMENRAFIHVLTMEKMVDIAERKVAIDEKPESTGDKMKLLIESSSPDTAIDRLFEIIIERENKVTQTDQKLEIELSYPEGSPPSSFHHLSSALRDFVRDYYSFCGNGVEIEIIFDTGEKDSMRYILTSGADYWERQARVASVNVSSGKIQPTQEGGVGTMKISLKPSEDTTSSQALEELINKFMAEFNGVSADGTSVDLDMFAENYSGLERGAFSAEVMAQKREMMVQLKKLEEEKRKLGIVMGDTNALDATRKALRTNKNTPRSFTTLFSPDSAPRARNGGGKTTDNEKAKTGIMDTIGRLVDHVESLKNPDLHLLNPQFIPTYARTTLVATISSHFSGEIPHEIYSIQHEKQVDKAGIRVNQQIIGGVHAVPAPLDCQLVGFYHPDAEVLDKISFSANLSKNMFSMQAEEIVPPGLELYFEHKPENSVTTPATEMESQELLDIEFLPPKWKQLVETINQDGGLSEKQKSDIVLTAWLHAFTYDDDPEIDSLIAEEIERLVAEGVDEESARYLANISVSKGNCGYVSEGFLALVRAVGLESTEAIGYLGDGGRFFPGPHNHGINLVKIDGSWTYVEPQRGYLSDSVNRADIPAKYQAIVRRLPRGIRNYSTQNVARENTGIRDVIEELKKAKLAGDPSVREILAELGELMGEDASMYEYLWEDEVVSEPEELDIIANQQPSIEQIIKFLAEQPDDINAEGFNIDFSDLPPELLLELMKSFELRSPEQETNIEIRRLKEELEQERSLRMDVELDIELERERKKRRLRITRMVVATATAVAITGLVVMNVGLLEIGPISIPEISLPSLPSINIPEIISKIFTPETPVAIPVPVEPLAPEIVEKIILPTPEQPLPIFTWRDIKYVATAFFSLGGGTALGSTAILMTLMNRRADLARRKRRRSSRY